MISFSEHIKDIDEGVNDPAIFKAIFLAGGPGSGKTFIVGKTGLTSLGFRVVNSDTAFENALKKAGVEMNPDNIFSVKGQEIRGKAKELTAKQQGLYIKGRLGLVIDGTGRDSEKILKQKKMLERLGYSTAMILVNTDKETALKRNDARPRRLDPKEVGNMWNEVQRNLGQYQREFKSRLTIVDNSDGVDYNKETLRAYRIMSKFANAEPMNPIAKKWIKTQKEEYIAEDKQLLTKIKKKYNLTAKQLSYLATLPVPVLTTIFNNSLSLIQYLVMSNDKPFTNFITEQKNTHMTHIEDKVLYGGVKGTREAINALREIRDMLAGKSSSKISTKWDGAPAIFCGEDPRDGEFFVAKKGIFAKNPKVYKTNADIDADTSGDLADKLKLALKYLKPLNIKQVIQGDFLFTKQDLNREKIEGKQYVTFHPNTIVYAVPMSQSKSIMNSKIGIVWHTTYTGSSFENMKASFGVKNPPMSKDVWGQDAMLTNASQATMNEKETAEVTQHLSTAGFLFNKVAGSTLRELEKNQKLAQTIEQFNNTYVRKGQMHGDSKVHTEKLIKFIQNKYQQMIDKRKTDKGKGRQQDKLDAILKFFSPQNKQSLIQMFELQKQLVFAKLKLINRLNSISNIDAFVKTRNGYKTTGAEGYVAIDKIGKGAVKLVDRLEFSYNNFSPDILKGWDKPK
tara:strand:- start:3658 stop:5697 length:2040 start_codon:yes stop_codon:yes gene_type:complete